MGRNRGSNRELAMAALVSTPTIRAASAACGVSESCLWKYLQEPDFSRELEAQKGKVIAVAAERLRSRLDSATETVCEIMTDEEAAPQVRITAARTVFEYAAKYTEQSSIIARLDALETAQEGSKQ